MANYPRVRVIARGRFQGQDVEVSWSKADFIQGHEAAFEALVRKSASITGECVPTGERGAIYGGYLHHPIGFAHVAELVLEDVEIEFPDGEPGHEWREEREPAYVPPVPDWA